MHRKFKYKKWNKILILDHSCPQSPSFRILGDPGAVSRVDKMFVVKVYRKIETILQ